MKTTLPQAIENAEQGLEFLTELHKNGESYHPEDDANDVVWSIKDAPTSLECCQLNGLMQDIYDLNLFDPCDALLKLSLLNK